MSSAALLLVICAALLHAYWNLLAKRSGGGATFVWLYSLVETLVYAPALGVFLWVEHPLFGWREAAVIGGTALLHLCYSLSLQTGYRRADLSVVYPIARGFGPLLSSATAMVWLGERLSVVAGAGALLIVAGVFICAGGPVIFRSTDARVRHGIAWGLLTGAFIAGYTVLDGCAVKIALMSPLLLDYSGNFVRLLLLTPNALRRRDLLARQWRETWRFAVGVGALAPLAYILVLGAMRWAPISAVAPAREISMMLGVFLGAKILNEGDARRRLISAAMMILGVIALMWG